MIKFKMPMNLQMFAEDNPNGGASPAEPVESTDEANETTPLEPASDNDDLEPETHGETNEPTDEDDKPKYTDKDMDAIVQKRLAREKAKAEQAEKLAQMSAAEKAKFKVEEATKRAQEAEAKIAKFEMAKQVRSMTDDLDFRLTDSDIDQLVTTDADTTKARVDWAKDLVSRALEAQKAELLKGTPPRVNGESLKPDTGSLGKRLASQNAPVKRPDPFALNTSDQASKNNQL